jgi:protein-S-isoprenylcysteine O-methyltransferase Ste14
MKKTLAFLYGIVAYLVFLVAFLYAIGFAGNLWVPKNIDSGTDPGLLNALLVDASLLGLFALQHSVMARPAFKAWWTRIVSPAIERSTYVLLASLILILLYWQWRPMQQVIWRAESTTTIRLIYSVYFLGWAIVFFSTFMINHFELFGLKQIYDNFKQQPPQGGKFKQIFFYKVVRHPIMLGFIIAFWAAPTMTMGHLVFAIATTLYILIAVKFFEERDLMKAHGEDYAAYKAKVPMIVPFTARGK